MEIIPLWTKKIDLSPRALDPLGLSRISMSIVDELLPGLTTLTTMGRNYTFYCWAIQQANKGKARTYTQFLKTLERLEAAYVVGGLLDQQKNFPEGKGPIGRNKGQEAIFNIKDNSVDVNFNVLKHSGGGYSQYYKTPLFKLGLIVTLQQNDQLINDGVILANAFDKNVENTRYYREFISEDNIPKHVLEEYGQSAGYLRLNTFIDEKKALTTILLNENKNLSNNKYSRKDTLLIILELFKIYSNYGLEFDDTEFRNIIYYQQSIKGSQKVSFIPPNESIKKTLAQWKFFQFHEYFTCAIESIFCCFLDSIEEYPAGLTIPEFIELNSSFIDEFVIILDNNVSGLTISDILGIMLKNNGIQEVINKKASVLFDQTVGVDHNFSEYALSCDLKDSLDNKDHLRAIALAFHLLLTTIIRYWQYLDSFDEDHLWITNKETNEWGLRTYIQKIQPEISKITLIELFKLTLMDIVDTHDKIAMTKMIGGNDTFRFQRNGEIFSFMMQYQPDRRGDRFHSITSIFEDIGFVERIDEILSISSDGIRFLEEYNYG
jgi:hypothetical protein